MSLKERATKEFKEKIDSDEEIRESILTYSECEIGFSGLLGVPNGNSVPIRGVLAYTEKSLLFLRRSFL
ncbi:hypothetical protein [Priestia megaterium]|uniref:hypothetical protein n=1 Tax=Priestia megaterium TaxID=1404 RepID=UPI001E5DD982|nr:hypothetical protein [Priestia megaterium]